MCHMGCEYETMPEGECGLSSEKLRKGPPGAMCQEHAPPDMICDHAGKRQACDACPHAKEHVPMDGCNLRGMAHPCFERVTGKCVETRCVEVE